MHRLHFKIFRFSHIFGDFCRFFKMLLKFHWNPKAQLSLASGLRSICKQLCPIAPCAYRVHLSISNHEFGSKLYKDHIKAVAAKTCNEDDDKNRYFLVLTTLTSSLVWLSISTLRKSGPPTSVSLSSSARRAASVLSRVHLFTTLKMVACWFQLKPLPRELSLSEHKCAAVDCYIASSKSCFSLGGTSLLLERVCVSSHAIISKIGSFSAFIAVIRDIIIIII